MVSIFVRTFIIYLLLTLAMKIMGKREIGELDVGELVSTLLISEVAAIPIDDPDLPLMNAIVPILFILSLEILISYGKTRSNKLKSVIEGRASYLIYKGRILESALKENRLTLNELISEIRTQGIGDIGDVSYAILEQNGRISIIKRSDGKMRHNVIIDGEYMTEEMSLANVDIADVEAALQKKNLDVSEVMLMTATGRKSFKIVRKDAK